MFEANEVVAGEKCVEMQRNINRFEKVILF